MHLNSNCTSSTSDFPLACYERQCMSVVKIVNFNLFKCVFITNWYRGGKGNSLWRKNKWRNGFLPEAVSLISLRKCFLTVIIRKTSTFDLQMFYKIETLLFARKIEAVDSLISVLNGVLKKKRLKKKICECAPNRL